MCWIKPVWDSTDLGAVWGNAGWPGGRPGGLTTRSPPPNHSLHKNAEVADYDLSNHLLSYVCYRSYACAVDQGFTTYDLPGVAIKSSPSYCPHSTGTSSPGKVASKESLPISKSLLFSKSPPFGEACFVSGLQRQPSRASPQASSEDLVLCASLPSATVEV